MSEPQQISPETRPEGGVGLLERPTVDSTLDGSHDKMTHIVVEGFHHRDQNDRWEKVQPDVFESMVTGTPIVALCGKTWVPDESPRRPLCGTCKDIAVRNGWKIPTA